MGTVRAQYGKTGRNRGLSRFAFTFVLLGFFGAGDRDRTGDIQLGKLAFYR
jgi:hypothetical protein